MPPSPVSSYATRLLFRGRGAPRSVAGIAFDRSIFEPVHFVMERPTMIGIKQLAEGESRHRWANHVQVALWTITFVFFVVSALKVLRQRQWQRPLTGFVSAGLLLHVLTLLQPQALIGANLTALLAAILWWRGVWGNFPQTAISSASTPARAA